VRKAESELQQLTLCMEKADKISLIGYDISVLHVGRLAHGLWLGLLVLLVAQPCQLEDSGRRCGKRGIPSPLPKISQKIHLQ
jgi:hypothetical protein